MSFIRSILFTLFSFLILLGSNIILCHKGCAQGCTCKQRKLEKNSSQKKQKINRKQKTKKHSGKKTKRKRKKNRKKEKKEKRLSRQDYDQLKNEKEKLVAKGKHEIAIKYIERMVPLCNDLGELAELMLELADLLFDGGHLTKAERLYSEFANLYPGHKQAEYANYKAIICCYWKTLDHRCDQSKTKETIEYAHSFLERKTVFTTYADQVNEILHACNEKLLESEMNIFHFYLKQGNYLAAHTRLQNIEKEFLPLLPEKEALLISLACELAEKQNNTQVLEEKKLILAQRFPEFLKEPTVVAVGEQQKRAVDKF